VKFGLVAGTLITASETLSVISILPDIEADLRGMEWYGWVATGFFLGSMIGIVEGGELAERRGLSPALACGIATFTVGLLIGGLAPSMPVLVVGRFVQGFGAGIIPAVAYVAIARVFDEDERPGLFAMVATAWVVPGLLGPVLAERGSHSVGGRWVFLGLTPAIVVAGTFVVLTMRAVPPLAGEDDAPPLRFRRRRIVEATRVAGGAALVVLGLTARSLVTVPAIVAGVVVGLGPLRRLTPVGTLRGRAGLPAVIASRALLMFAFYGVESFVPYALHRGRGAAVFVGSLAVTLATVFWTAGSWVQDKWIGALGEVAFIRLGFIVMMPAILVVAVTASSDLPFWLIHVAWALGGFGIGLASAAHAELAMRTAADEEIGVATSSLQLAGHLGMALGAGAVGVIVAFGGQLGWPAGDAVGIALCTSLLVAGLGLVLVRRLPGRRRDTAVARVTGPAPSAP
jgi:MFS family permease